MIKQQISKNKIKKIIIIQFPFKILLQYAWKELKNIFLIMSAKAYDHYQLYDCHSKSKIS